MSTYRHGTNYYEILEVDREAPQNEIHAAYQRAKATYSTDNPALYSMFSKEEARELLRMIEEAYAVIGNQAQRKLYDRQLDQGGGAGAGVAAGAGASSKGAKPSTSASRSETSAAYPGPPQTALPELSHEQLPDFAAPEGASSSAGANDRADAGGPAVGENYIVRKKPASASALPAGTARTSYSTYKIDESLESEFNALAEWDGTALQRMRVYKNVSLDQVSEATRISRAYLTAIETNDFARLPAAVFVRGFVIQISRALGLDDAKISASYMKMFRERSGK